MIALRPTLLFRSSFVTVHISDATAAEGAVESQQATAQVLISDIPFTCLLITFYSPYMTPVVSGVESIGKLVEKEYKDHIL